MRKVVIENALEEGTNAYDFVEQVVSHIFHCCQNVEQVEFWKFEAPLTMWGTAFAFFREYAASLRKVQWDSEEDEEGFLNLRDCVKTRCVKSLGLNTATLVSLLKA